MPLFLSTLVGGIIQGLISFFSSKGATILAGLGLTFIGVKGFEVFLGYVINDISLIANTVNSIQGGSGTGSGIARTMFQIAAYAGLFDALNIIMSGYMAFASLTAVSFAVKRATQ